MLARIQGSDGEVVDRAKELVPRFTRTTGVLNVRAGGQAAVFKEVNETIEHDARVAEGIAFPLTLLLLVLVFGSVVAAALPLGVGALAVVGTFLVLRVVASFTEVSIFALNLTTAMGLGLAIDYSLFVVSRFREERHAGAGTHEAVQRTVNTAGRTVAFSALTVAASLAALLVFPLPFLRSFSYAGIAVVALAAVGAVVVLPALLAVLGPRVDKLRVFRRKPKEVGEGVWHRIALAVMRRPVPIATGVIGLLVVLGLPFLGVNLGLPDDRVLPEGKSSRAVAETIRRDFSSNEAAATTVVVPHATTRKQVASYAAALSQVAGVTRVDAQTGSYAGGRRVFPATAASTRFAGKDATWLSVVPGVDPLSPAGERMVTGVRNLPSPYAGVLVGGPSAELVDAKRSVTGSIPLAALLVALATFVVLFLSFGSLLVSAKAVVLNLLSLSATFGAMVWIFQDGHLAGLLGFTATGAITATMPVLMFCIAFGLSMDYEVFLLSRIKEEHDRGADNATAVATGLERTGRIVTAAALLISLVFAAFGASGISFMKMFGVGLTMAVLMDATLIRAALVLQIRGLGAPAVPPAGDPQPSALGTVGDPQPS